MEIIPVLDIAAGVAVHARAGNRSGYTPVPFGRRTRPSWKIRYALLRGFREILGTKLCYVADLDAIQGGAVQRTVLSELAKLDVGSGPLLVDAGTYEVSGAIEVFSCGADEVVVGLETLRSFADLATIVSEVGTSRVIFSLDLRLGRPVLHSEMQDFARDSRSRRHGRQGGGHRRRNRAGIGHRPSGNRLRSRPRAGRGSAEGVALDEIACGWRSAGATRS